MCIIMWFWLCMHAASQAVSTWGTTQPGSITPSRKHGTNFQTTVPCFFFPSARAHSIKLGLENPLVFESESPNRTNKHPLPSWLVFFFHSPVRIGIYPNPTPPPTPPSLGTSLSNLLPKLHFFSFQES